MQTAREHFSLAQSALSLSLSLSRRRKINVYLLRCLRRTKLSPLFSQKKKKNPGREIKGAIPARARVATKEKDRKKRLARALHGLRIFRRGSMHRARRRIAVAAGMRRGGGGGGSGRVASDRQQQQRATSGMSRAWARMRGRGGANCEVARARGIITQITGSRKRMERTREHLCIGVVHVCMCGGRRMIHVCLISIESVCERD